MSFQATAVAATPANAMEIGTPPKNVTSVQAPPPQFRVLTSSNSFDSKSNLPSFAARFHMSAEATKLFNTLQQSPLPPGSEVRIQHCDPVESTFKIDPRLNAFFSAVAYRRIIALPQSSITDAKCIQSTRGKNLRAVGRQGKIIKFWVSRCGFRLLQVGETNTEKLLLSEIWPRKVRPPTKTI